MVVALALGCGLAGCAAKPTGNTAAVKGLLGKRVGLVIRVARFVAVDSGSTQTYKNQLVIDAPDLAYLLALGKGGNQYSDLARHFDLIRLAEYSELPETKADMKLEGDLILMSPDRQKVTIPPDDELRKIIDSEKLEGLLIVDEMWSINKAMNLVSCTCDVRLLDRQGQEALQCETAGSQQYSTMARGFLSDLTLGTVGAAQSDEVVAAAEDSGHKAAQYLSKLIETFVASAGS
jgi:hypothetical protein